ncbi:Snf7-domain-containing protein [Kalaharituber pfeilii]|nr:Snf7-domain-containing protein [Kalaharituber pfeilii]
MGNSSSKQITSHDRAILDMKLQRDKIKQYQKRIQAVLDREHEIAKECLRKGDKARARLALRRKKYQEQLLEKADKQLEILEELTATVEFSLMERDVFYGLQQGNAALKEIHKEMSLEAVEKLMDETAEGIAYQREIDALLGSCLTNDDEDEVEDELAAMEAEQLPAPPTTDPAQKAETVEEIKARRAKERTEARKKQLEEARSSRQMIPA